MHEIPLECVPISGNLHLIFSLVVLLGILAGYFPQIHKLVSNKSVDGLSSLFLILGAIGTNSLLLNSVILQWTQLECCLEQELGDCLRNTLSVVQLAVQFVLFNSIVLLFYVYASGSKGSLVLLSSLFHFLFALLFAIFISYYYPKHIKAYAAFLGMLTLAVSLTQYIPQIYLTFKSGRVGALSIASLMIMAPGSFIFAWTLATSPGTNPSTWITLLFTGSLQTMLLVMCIIFHRKKQYIVLPTSEEEEEENFM